MDYKGIGQRIREQRQRYNLTLEALAEKVDLSPNYMGKIERGEKKFSFEAIVKISGCLNVTLDFLLYSSSEKNKGLYEIQALLNRCSNEQINFAADLVKTMLAHMAVKQ